MNYLIVCNTQGKYYLLMTKDGEQYAIRAYKSEEDVMNDFGGYTDAFQRDGTWVASATIGMMQMQPVAIKAPENEKDIAKYVKSMTLVHISGGAIGRGYHGLEVTPDILEYKQFEIWNKTMQKAGLI